MPSIGEGNEAVDLTIGGEKLSIWQSYEIRSSVLTQPGSFVLKMGAAATAASIIRKAEPNTKFQLTVDGQTLFVGRLDGPSSTNSSGTEVTIRGRDLLAPLHDDFVTADRTFTGITPKQLVRAALDEVGLADVPLSTRSNARADKPLSNPGSVKAGGRWYDYIKKQLDRVGLFLWSDIYGEFILSEPDSAQAPAYRCVRGTDGVTRPEGNIELHNYDNDVAKRFARYFIHGKGGIPKSGLERGHGSWIDEEMTAYGYRKAKVIKDTHCKSIADAEHMARRIAAETNRSAWKLQYTVTGHTTQSASGNGRRVWLPDTMVEVDDQELGIAGNFYLESCTYQRSPATSTTLTLMRPEHMIFATDFEG